MADLKTHQNQHEIVVIIVPFPAQGHLNQLLQLSCLISTYKIPVHYIGTAAHNHQAKIRSNGLNPIDIAKIHFHDLPNSSSTSPPINPNPSSKFPPLLQQACVSTFSQREPFTTYLREISSKTSRVIVIYDSIMAFVVQDIASIHNAESYAFSSIPPFSQACLIWEKTGTRIPLELRDLPLHGEDLPEEVQSFVSLQFKYLDYRAGDIYNTCRSIEAPYLDLLASQDDANRKNYAIGPMLPSKLSLVEKSDKCLKWLDKKEENSVIFINFGTTTTLSDEQIEELSLGLEQSKQKFLWVLRDADSFDGEVGKRKLPKGFEDRVKEVGMVVKDWAPQPEILAHSSTGGFLSHCGWNSCIESIAMGVPVAAWPMHSEQPINAVFLTKILKMGLLVKEWTQREELVKASSIEIAVKKLMVSEKGNEMRKRAEELSDIVQQATEEGGVSRLELDSFIAHITRENDH